MQKEQPIFDAGLVIRLESEEGRCLLNCLAGTNDIEELEELFDAEWYSVAENLPNTTYYDAGNQTMFFIPMMNTFADGTVNCDKAVELNGNIFVITLPDIVKFYGVPYRNADELVTKFKKLVGTYLPDNFDYIGHIGIVTGCYYSYEW